VKNSRKVLLASVFAAGSMIFQGCPVSNILGGFLSQCFGEDTISASAYHDLNIIEQLLYEENDCGRYEPKSDFISDIL